MIVVLSMFIHRSFCKYICPLGAFYGLFQKISLLRLKLDEDKCVNCGECTRVCPTGALHFNLKQKRIKWY